MRISDWSSDVCSSDLRPGAQAERVHHPGAGRRLRDLPAEAARLGRRLGAREADLGAEEAAGIGGNPQWVARGEEPPSVGLADIGSKVAMTREVVGRSEEPTSELQSLMRISSAGLC